MPKSPESDALVLWLEEDWRLETGWMNCKREDHCRPCWLTGLTP